MESSIPKPPRHSKSNLPFQHDNNRKYGTDNCELINKGSTCYVNASLQCLSTMVKCWSNFSAHTNKLPQFVADFVKIMSLLQTSKGALDPSYFLKCLKQIISKTGNHAFDLFSQQDVAQILSDILEELFGESLHVSESIRTHIRQTISSTACQQYTSTEYSSSILQLPVSESIQKSLSSYLEPNFWSGKNEFFCNICSSKHTLKTISVLKKNNKGPRVDP